MRPLSPRRAFAPAWLDGDAAARRLLDARFESAQGRVDAARRAASRRASAALIDELAAQHRHLPPSPARDRHLDALSAGGAAAVVSGQQVGLFTGPALCLYKAAGVVAAARALEAESGVRCVPVFWLQTEDHDWPEIAHCFVRGSRGCVRIDAGSGETPARIPVAARRFDHSIDDALAKLEQELAARPFAGETFALLRGHYSRGARPAEAFRGVLCELFADTGLLLVDPRTPSIAALARPLFERSFADAGTIAGVLTAQASAIGEAGFAVQVPVREGAPLAFFHPDGTDGPRYRLEPDRDGWRLCDAARTVSKQAVIDAIRRDPLHASSTALLRPLVQDALFPTAAYLGGPAEIAYFAELAPLYAHFAMEMPILAPRPSFCVTEPGDRRRLEALGLRFDEVLGDHEALLARLANVEDRADVGRSLTSSFTRSLEEFSRRALSMDPALAGEIDKTRSAVERSVAKLADRYCRSAARRDTTIAARLDAVRDALAPGGTPQERCYGLASLAAQHGTHAFARAVLDAVVPFDGRTREMAL